MDKVLSFSLFSMFSKSAPNLANNANDIKADNDDDDNNLHNNNNNNQNNSNNDINKPSINNNSSLSLNTNEFPFKLGPFGVCKSDLLSKHFEAIVCHPNETGFYQIDPRQFKNDININFSELIQFISTINKLNQDVYSYGILGNISPLHSVTLDDKSKKAANIPLNAVSFAWCYPSILPKNILSSSNFNKKWLKNANIILLTVGGYMYFDLNNKLLQINTLIPAKNGGLQFSKPIKWDNRFTMTLHKNGRFQEITIASLSSAGAKYFCWIFPNECIINEKYESKIFTKHGGFVYLFHEPGDTTNTVLCNMDRYFEVLSGNDFIKSNKKQLTLHNNDKIQRKYWKLTYIEYKKKELQSLKNKLKDFYKNNNLINDNNDNNDNDLKQNDLDDDKIVNWDDDRMSNWLNDIDMNELRIPFYRNKINGKMLCDNSNNNNDNDNNDNVNYDTSDIIKKLNLSKNELETIVIKQFNNHLNKLIKKDKNKEFKLKNKIKELQIEIESIQDAKICLICYKNNKNILIKPCNHVCCCDICIKDIKNCPLCNQKIQITEKIYN